MLKQDIARLALNCSVSKVTLYHVHLLPSPSAGITGGQCHARGIYWHLMHLLFILSSHQDIGTPRSVNLCSPTTEEVALEISGAQGGFPSNFSVLIVLSQ